jgi:lipopolysaccharide/colanic/teichoic acid biosynthesis glycosyltransferase
MFGPNGAVKRIVDLFFACFAIVVLLPVILVSLIIVFLTIGKPVLFNAERLGFKGKRFMLYKLRTMTNEVDPDGNLLPDEIRLTRAGAILRKMSVDELPGLINVVKGEMSLVGPRPFTSLYDGRYSEEQFKRHDVKPGITGWSQINGRNALRWEDKFELDLWYISNWSLYLDFKIMFLTAVKVLAMKDVNHEQHATAPEFLGSTDPK